MKGVLSNFKMELFNVEINEKLFKRLIIVFIVFIIIYCALTMSSLLVFKTYTIGAETTVVDEGMNTHIDLLESDSKKIEIAGWAYMEGEPIRRVNSSYILKNKDTGKMYKMRTKMEDNINITEEEHKNDGMHAKALLIGLLKGTCDIYVHYKNDNHDILSYTLISRDIK